MRFDYRKLRRLPLGKALKFGDLIIHMTRRERKRFSRFFKCVLVRFAWLEKGTHAEISGIKYRGGYRYTISLSISHSGWESRRGLLHELRHAEQSMFSILGMTKMAVYTKSTGDSLYFKHPAEMDARTHERLSTWFKKGSKTS